MDLRKQIKNLANNTLGNNIQIHIDYVFLKDAILIISGWCALPKDVDDPQLILKYKKDSLSTQSVLFERPDVEISLSGEPDKTAFGFVIGTTGIESAADLSVECGLCSVYVSQFADKPLTDIGPIKSDAGESAEEVLDMFEELGLSLTPKAASSLDDPDIRFVKETVELLDPTAHDFVQQCSDEILPALHARWKKRLEKSNRVELLELGENNQTPAVSLIIPLYGRYDFIQHQIAAFAKDDDFTDYEIIYVLDDPRLRHEVKVTAHGVFAIFGLPFKVLFSSINLGFAGANNLGCEYASSETILLLNSDILPSAPGWLAQLQQEFGQTENCGMMSAVLLYEDDTIQHAGMTFRQDPSIPGIWMNHHPDKGFPKQLVDKTGVHYVDSVTGACVMMDKALFESVGGFESMYILGDFEDSDLCLKVLDKGYKLAVSYNVNLYHLERLSQTMMSSDMWKQKLTYVNGAFQVQRWQTYLQEHFS